METYFTVREAAEYLGVPHTTFEQHRMRGRPNHPPYERILGTIRYRKSDLDEYIAQRRVVPAGSAA